ncbi:MAG TPA: serine/threonine-protein kinase PknK [Chitinispirillaceae bacterium]|nr:serine/threonine-protein kinase PknK [Chitinispirillaceae bacterium]
MEISIRGYKLTEKLYESSRTLVYRGQRITSGERVILKILKSEAASEKEQARIRHEYNLTSRLHLSGVVSAIALETFQCNLIMTMKDSGGTSLDRYPLPLPLEQFFKVAISLTDAVGQLHQLKIIHKDINPANIIWNAETGQIQLIDFSFADVVPERTITPHPPLVPQGTLEYISPEQTGRMNRVVDYRTDYYSLGVVFYQLLTGKLPFCAPDALGIIHLHIAGIPVAPHVVNAAVPEMVSKIVLKLMSKMADDRYQSPRGLKTDLERCFQEYTAKGAIQHFDLGKEDYTNQLQVPQKLYGREQETEQLLNAFKRSSTGNRELFLVAGYAGIGKTALVHEMYRSIAEKRGYFIEGKFDQLQQNVPYYAWIQAFTGFVYNLLMENETQVAKWKENILNAIGDIGRVLTDVIPNLELIIGPQPDVPLLGPAEAPIRFNYVFLEFIGAIGTMDHPLVIFLDDLQWIDAASLTLLQTLMSSVSNLHILIIGAYRDDEVDALHPLTKSIESLRKKKTSVQLLTLGNLSEENVNQIIEDSLHVRDLQTVPLTHLIYAKTGGNPFFLLQTLRSLAERQVISYDDQKRAWKWDVNTLKHVEITDNVVSLMLDKIRKLPIETQRVLTLAACVGFRFSISNLSIIAEQSEESALANLLPALQEGLIISLDTTYQFVHDRILEAAYALIPQEQKAATHLKIGRLLLAQCPQEALEERLFDIVDQFNHSVELVTNADEKAMLCRLNMAAGRKARSAIAYASGQGYFAQAMTFLPPNHWNECYSESLALYQELAECNYLIGNFQYAEELLSAAQKKARTTIDLVGIHRLRMRLYQLSGHFSEALLEETFEILRLFKVTFPETEEDIQTAAAVELQHVFDHLQGRRIYDLCDIPLTSDAVTRALTSLFADAIPLMYVMRPGIYTLFTSKAVNFCLQHGHAAESSFLYSNFATALLRDTSNIPIAYQFSEMAIELNARTPGAAFVKRKVLFMHSVYIMVWRDHYAKSLPLMEQTFNACLDFGDFICINYLSRLAIWRHLENGDPLERVIEIAQHYIAISQKIHSNVAYNSIRVLQQFALALQGKTFSLTDFNDVTFNEASTIETIRQTGFHGGIAFYYIMKQIAAFIDEQYDEALKWANRAADMLRHVWNNVIEVTHYFYRALTMSALYAGVTVEQQRQFTQTIGEIQGKLKRWSDYCPENFANCNYLVSAEIARIEERDKEAMCFYDQAIRSTRDNNFVHQEALATEVASRFYRMRGFDRIADAYLHDTRDCYVRWGALGKVRQLEHLYPRMTQPQPRGEEMMEYLDLSTIMKATHAISGEIEMNRLLNEVMHTVIENAGAESGFLLMERSFQGNNPTSA